VSNASHGGKGDRNRSSNTSFRNGWDAIFRTKETQAVEDIDPVVRERIDELLHEMGTGETISDKDYKEVFEAPLTQVQIDRKLKEWGMMYDCLQNISLYEYPVEEAKALLKQIKIS
jgi:hypothetical protein